MLIGSFSDDPFKIFQMSVEIPCKSRSLLFYLCSSMQSKINLIYNIQTSRYWLIFCYCLIDSFKY